MLKQSITGLLTPYRFPGSCLKSGLSSLVSSLSHPWSHCSHHPVCRQSVPKSLCQPQSKLTDQGRQVARVPHRHRDAQSFKRRLPDNTALMVLAQQTSHLTLRFPQRFPEPGVRTQVYTTAPLKLTFPEDPPYGSGLKESTTPQAKQFQLRLFSLTRPSKAGDRRVSREATENTLQR